jgi:hypothetical protein
MPLFPPVPTTITIIPSLPPATYRAIIDVAAAAGQAVEIVGSALKVALVKKIVLKTSAAATLSLTLQSVSSGSSGSAPITSFSSVNPPASITVKTYTSAPTPGVPVGDLIYPSTTGISEIFAGDLEQAPTLNTNTQSIAVATSAPVTITGYIEWTEA